MIILLFHLIFLQLSLDILFGSEIKERCEGKLYKLWEKWQNSKHRYTSVSNICEPKLVSVFQIKDFSTIHWTRKNRSLASLTKPLIGQEIVRTEINLPVVWSQKIPMKIDSIVDFMISFDIPSTVPRNSIGYRNQGKMWRDKAKKLWNRNFWVILKYFIIIQGTNMFWCNIVQNSLRSWIQNGLASKLKTSVIKYLDFVLGFGFWCIDHPTPQQGQSFVSDEIIQNIGIFGDLQDLH